MQREIMSSDIESVPFHAARLRNDRKVSYLNSDHLKRIFFIINYYKWCYINSLF